MKSKQRELLLMIVAGMCVGLYLTYLLIFSPMINKYGENEQRIAKLQKQVDKGRQLLRGEKSINTRWKDMLKTDLSDDSAKAET